MSGWLDRLREIGEAATPGPWRWKTPLPWDDKVQVLEGGEDGRTAIVRHQTYGWRVREHNVAFTETFDPPTALALVDVAEAAEKLLAVTICRRFTVEFCYQRAELPQVEWCKTCIWREELAAELASLREAATG